MKAVQINSYGGVEVLEVNENVDKPSAGGGQEASSVVHEVKKAGKAVLTSGYLQMTITKPSNFEKMSPIKTSYKYQIQVATP